MMTPAHLPWSPHDDHVTEDPVMPEAPVTFDEDGRPCAVAHPTVCDDPPEPPKTADSIEDAKIAVLYGLLDFVALGEVSPEDIGWRVISIRRALGMPTPSNTEFAAELKVSPGRVSQKLNTPKRETTAFLRAVDSIESHRR